MNKIKKFSSIKTKMILTTLIIIFVCVICRSATFPPTHEINATQEAIPTLPKMKQTANTATIEPSVTTQSTQTIAPYSTPTLTSTSTPTPPLEPILFEGTGDSIVDLVKWKGPAIVIVEGNAESQHFAVTTYDDNGDYLDLIVNVIDPYRGVRLIDFENTLTSRFEVNAAGNWKIIVRPLSDARVLEIPGIISGEGDEVIALIGAPDKITINGNEAAHHFAVLTHGGSYPDVIVSTIDPYQGVVIAGADTIVLEIMATGLWTLDIMAEVACECSGDIYNCGDFQKQSEAQKCFNYCVNLGRGDVHRLDGNDNDRLACESLP